MEKQKALKRSRINRALENIFDYPLTIVEAPMGYGKTTAVREFLVASGYPPLWVSFLSADDTASFFWDKLSNEIGKLDKEAGESLKSLGFPSDAPQTATILLILSDIEFEKNTVLVIDDFHFVKTPQIGEFLSQIVRQGIENFHIAVITRDTSNLVFAELSSKRLCYIVPQQILRFTGDEIRGYCTLMGFTPSESDIKQLAEYTGGWISLIYLILLGMEQGVPLGRNSAIDELVEKVLFNACEAPIRRFLLDLSVMDSFTAEQALFVTQEPQANEFLKKLRRENAFVAFDELAGVYKIHNVLLDFLRAKLKNINERAALWRRLGDWYLKRHEYKSAYGYFYRAGENERILSHLDDVQYRETLTQNSAEFDGMNEFFSSQPRDLLFKYPIAYLQFISIIIRSGKARAKKEGVLRLNELEAQYKQAVYNSPERKNRVLAECNVIRVIALFNDAEKMKTAAAEAARLFHGGRTCLVRQDGEFTFGSPHLLYSYYREHGKLKETADFIAAEFPAFFELANGCGTGGEYLVQAEYALAVGDWQAAELNAFKAIYKANTKKQTSILLCANFALIRLYSLQGKIDEAMELLRQLRSDVADENRAIFNTTLELIEGYVYACLGRLDRIPGWLQTGDMSPGSFMFEGIGFNYIVYGKAVLLSKNYIKLEMLTEVFPQYFAVFHNQLGFLQNRIFAAAAKYRLYSMEAGCAELKEALDMAREDHLIPVFAEYAPDIKDMMRRIVQDSPRDAYAKEILLACGQYIDRLKRAPQGTASLSEREREILTLAAKGLKRNEIAGQLHVSASTIKTHMENIYRKLDVRGKTEAIKKAENLKIL